MTALCFTDGHPSRLEPNDRGLAYGDGVFETMAAAGGRIRWLGLHLERLTEGCERLAMPLPDRAWLEATLLEAAAGAGRAVVKLIVTRGTGQRGYAPPERPHPTVIVSTAPWPERSAAAAREGIRVRTCELKLGENPKLAGIKHLCRLEQVLAQLELEGTGADEGMLLSTSGWIVGGISCNVFAVFESRIATPRLNRFGVRGVMRRVVMERAQALGYEVDERDLPPESLVRAEELFMTNALTGIRPVRDLDGRSYAVGPITRSLQTALAEFQ